MVRLRSLPGATPAGPSAIVEKHASKTSNKIVTRERRMRDEFHQRKNFNYYRNA